MLRLSAKIVVASLSAALVAIGWHFVHRPRPSIDLLQRLEPVAEISPYISVEPVEIAGSRRRALVSTRRRVWVRGVPIAPDSVLAFSIGLRESTWEQPGDGVTFRVRARVGQRHPLLYSRYVDAKANGANRRWIDVRLPLADLLSSHGELPSRADFALVTTPGLSGDARHDEPAWADVRVESGGGDGLKIARRPNVVLVSIDTLRADSVGASGDRLSATPHIDRLAAGGFRFRRAYAPANHTLQSHMSLLTGLLPKTHGVLPGIGRESAVHVAPLPEGRITLPEILRADGYSTAGFAHDCVWLQKRFGFGQGFERYSVLHHDAVAMNDLEIFPWLDANHADPFFLFVHYYDAHSDWRKLPYDAPDDLRAKHAGDYTGDFDGCRAKTCATRNLMALDAEGAQLGEEDLRYIRALYDAGVEATDRQVGRLVERLAALGVLDDTLVVVVSDHGEEFREHGRFVHTQLYEESIRIPVILRLPGRIPAGAGSDHPVSLLDLAPTILDLLGVDEPGEMEGRSVRPLLDALEIAVAPIYFSDTSAEGVIDWPWKLIRKRQRTELFNLEDDPIERDDLSVRAPEEVRRLSALLEGEVGETAGAGTRVDAADGDIERLRALGYVE